MKTTTVKIVCDRCGEDISDFEKRSTIDLKFFGQPVNEGCGHGYNKDICITCVRIFEKIWMDFMENKEDMGDKDEEDKEVL